MKDDYSELLRGFADRQANEQMEKQTFVIVELLRQLKKEKVWGGGNPKSTLILHHSSYFIHPSFILQLLRERFNKKMISLGSNACLRSKTYPPTDPPTDPPPGGV